MLCLWPHTRQATRLMAFVHELCLWSHMRQVLLWWGVPTRCICDVIPQLWNHQTAYLGGAKCRQTAAHTVCCSRCFACAWAGALFTPRGAIYQAHGVLLSLFCMNRGWGLVHTLRSHISSTRKTRWRQTPKLMLLKHCRATVNQSAPQAILSVVIYFLECVYAAAHVMLL